MIKFFKWAGSISSLCCAIHCIFTPILLIFFPLFQHSLLNNHFIELGFVLSSIVMGGIIIGSTKEIRTNVKIITTYLLGSFGLLLGFAIESSQITEIAGPIIMSFGGCILAYSYYLKHRIRHHELKQCCRQKEAIEQSQFFQNPPIR